MRTVQQEIVRRVAGLFALADQLELRLANARRQVAALTPSLLARAFAGKLVPKIPRMNRRKSCWRGFGAKEEMTMRGIEKKILDYLRSQPGAQDTLEGIVQWWLLSQRARESTATVKKALCALVQRRMVLEWRDRDGLVRYRANRRKKGKQP